MKKTVSFTLGMFLILFSVSSFAEEGEKEFTYQDNGKRDPMWPLVSPNGVAQNYETDLLYVDLTLEGIMAGANGNSLAIINGKVVRLNDEIGQFIVVVIDPDYVILKKDKKEFKLRLKKEE